MLWNSNIKYLPYPYEKEADLEEAVNEVKAALFGPKRIYMDDKRKIGKKGSTNNLPDGYLLDLSDHSRPRLFVVENDLASHHHIKHVAVQILEFSLSYAASKIKVKNIVKEMLQKRPDSWALCEAFARKHQYGNVDFLLESIIQARDSFNALLIIDRVEDELRTVLNSRFQFPVDIIELNRYKAESGDILYEFEPYQYEIDEASATLDPADIDTIVVAAQQEGFESVFLGENRWYSIRISASMIPKIKYIAAYQVNPISAITHIAKIARIEPYQETGKYILHFSEPAEKIKKVPIGKDRYKAPQAPRYSSRDRILAAGSMDAVY